MSLLSSRFSLYLGSGRLGRARSSSFSRRIHGSSSPFGGTSPFRILPWTGIAQFTTTLTFTSATKFLGKILLGHLRKQFGLIVRSQHLDLIDRNRVQESLDSTEDAAESPGCVDQVQLTQTFGVVVLRNGGGLTDVSINRRDAGDSDALEVHDGAAGFE